MVVIIIFIIIIFLTVLIVVSCPESTCRGGEDINPKIKKERLYHARLSPQCGYQSISLFLTIMKMVRYWTNMYSSYCFLSHASLTIPPCHFFTLLGLLFCVQKQSNYILFWSTILSNFSPSFQFIKIIEYLIAFCERFAILSKPVLFKYVISILFTAMASHWWVILCLK